MMDYPPLPRHSIAVEQQHPFDALNACPDSTRAAVIQRMHAALTTAQTVAEVQKHKKETPLVVPGDSVPHPTPPLLVGSIWRQLNSLRVMRQYCQTLSRMCHEYAFLRGHSITCVHGLEWFSSLNQPMLQVDAGVRSTLDRMLNEATAQKRGVARERLAYELYSLLPCPDRDLLRLAVGMHFPDAREYEVDICRHMAVVERLSYDQWLSRFFRWRSAGLYYPLAIAARRMQAPEQWALPKPLAGTPVARTFFAALASLSTPGQKDEDRRQALEALAAAWDEDCTGAAHSLASTLDRLAVLMRVKSNGRRENPLDFALDDALDAFPHLSEQPASGGVPFFPSRCMGYSAWRSLKAAVEDVFPPSTLCAPLTRPRRSTWGFPRLTLELLPGPVLRFRERALALVPGTHDIAVARRQQPLPSTTTTTATAPASHRSLMPIKEHCVTFAIQAEARGGEQKRHHCVKFADQMTDKEYEEEEEEARIPDAAIPHPSALFSDCLAAQTSNRVQDVLWRLGELLLSPDVALCMLYPTVALASLDGSQDPVWQRYSELCLDREHLLDSMTPVLATESNETALIQQQHFERYLARLEACLPPVHCVHYKNPKEMLLWRVDTPPRLLIYVGEPEAMHPAASSRHLARKVLLNGKASVRTICQIAMLPQEEPHSQSLEEECVRASLRAFAASSLLEHPANVVLVKGYGPVTSTTLAETLASLTLAPVREPTVRPLGQPPPRWGGDTIDERYAEKQVAPNGFRFRDWIAMHSAPSGTHQSRLAAHVIRFDALYHTKLPWLCEDGNVRWVRMASTAPPENRTLQGRTLRQAVEARYMHDLRMLPVREQGDAVLRANAEIYAEAPGSVAIVYAPTGEGPSRLELIAFQHPSEEGLHDSI